LHLQAILLGAILIIIFFIRQIYFSKTCRIDDHAKTSYHHSRKHSDVSVFKDAKLDSKTLKLKNLFLNAWEVSKSFTFILRILTLSTFFFLTSGLQFWVTSYIIDVIKLDKLYTYIYYSLTLLTAPLLGVMVGFTLTSYFNKFKSKLSVVFIMILSLILCGICYTITLSAVEENIIYFGINLWFIFFIIFIQIQNFISLILYNYDNSSNYSNSNSNIESERREALKEDNMQTISFIINLSSNLFGYFLGPLIYGVILNSYIDSKPKLPFQFFVYYSFVSLFMVLIVFIFKVLETSKTNVIYQQDIVNTSNTNSNKLKVALTSNQAGGAHGVTKVNVVHSVFSVRICGIGSFVLGNYVSQTQTEVEKKLNNIDEDRISVVSCGTDQIERNSAEGIEFNGNTNNRLESITLGVSDTPNFGNFIGSSQNHSPVSSNNDNVMKMKLKEEMSVKEQSLFGLKSDLKNDLRNENIN